MATEYDALAQVYTPWSKADPAAALTFAFYTDLCRGRKGPVVELGIGDGRIGIQIAKEGCRVIGVDTSIEMLSRCQARAEELGISHRIELLQADIRNFLLPQPAPIIILPFRTFGHLLSRTDKLSALKQIYQQLEPEGLFAFDHYIFDDSWARNHDGVPRLMCRFRDEAADYTSLVWDTYQYNFDEQLMECLVTIEEIDAAGVVRQRRHNPLSFSWVTPDQVRDLLQEAGFEELSLYGDFSLSDFGPSSMEQVWIATRKGH